MKSKAEQDYGLLSAGHLVHPMKLLPVHMGQSQIILLRTLSYTVKISYSNASLGDLKKNYNKLLPW